MTKQRNCDIMGRTKDGAGFLYRCDGTLETINNFIADTIIKHPFCDYFGVRIFDTPEAAERAIDASRKKEPFLTQIAHYIKIRRLTRLWDKNCTLAEKLTAFGSPLKKYEEYFTGEALDNVDSQKTLNKILKTALKSLDNQ